MAVKVNDVERRDKRSVRARAKEKILANYSDRKTVVDSKNGWFDIDLIELWRYRDLIMLLVKRDFVVNYKQTVLGPAWFFLQPIASALIFTIVFGKIANIPTDGLPNFIFYMAGITIWNLCSSIVTKISGVFVNNATIFNKIYFPRLAMPAANTIMSMITFVVQLLLFFCFALYFYLNGADIKPNAWILMMPVLVVQVSMLSMGIGMIVAAYTTKYRDLMLLVGFGVQLWMYITPIVYPLSKMQESQIPQKLQWLVSLNPMVSVVEAFRYSVLGAGSIQLWQIALSAVITIVTFIVGLMVFGRTEKTFTDTV